jgi:hypothetical protein
LSTISLFLYSSVFSFFIIWFVNSSLWNLFRHHWIYFYIH